MFGNRGGRFHRDDRTLGRGAGPRASGSAACCDSRERHHPVWRDRYTALFFLDEVTALAAGHRPCFECRRRDAKAFAEKWAQAKSGGIPHAPEMDVVLQKERLDGRDKRTHEMPVDELPDGAFIAIDGHASAVRGAQSACVGRENGYVERRPRPPAPQTCSRRRASLRCCRPGICRNGIRVLNSRCIHKTRRRSTGPANTHPSHCHKPIFLIAVGSVLGLFFLQ